MKKIVVSLSIIAVAAAIAIGGTVAYFSDTEVSSGNTFTAGTLDLTIDNECWLGGEYVYESDCNWELKDLEEGIDFFFNFSDLKPGDWGEDTVSLHVTNDAWACVVIYPISNDDVDCTEPEMIDEEGYGCYEPNEDDWDGDLAQNLAFFFWADICDDPQYEAIPGDNIYQEGCDWDLMYGYASDILYYNPYGVVYTLASPYENNMGGYSGEPLIGGEDYYIGKTWCFGEWDYDGEGYFCDGSLVNNASQSDAFTGDIIFYAEQSRNNPDFSCEEWWYGGL
jgi:predicted ribosomally synthesized peptide with SipW-like signal peptide